MGQQARSINQIAAAARAAYQAGLLDQETASEIIRLSGIRPQNITEDE